MEPEANWQETLKLLCFSGDEPLVAYLIQVQLAAQLNGWFSKEVAIHVALSLEGKALQTLIDL